MEHSEILKNGLVRCGKECYYETKNGNVTENDTNTDAEFMFSIEKSAQYVYSILRDFISESVVAGAVKG